MRLLDQVRRKIRAKHFSMRTEEAYTRWIERYLRFVRDSRGKWIHPAELGSPEVNEFLTDLAVNHHVAASTQNQALSALLFLYTTVLDKELKFDAVRAKQPHRLPVVLSVPEVPRILSCISSLPIRLMAGLMYGAGLRLMECCRLRIKDVDFDRKQIIVREGKGDKDRMVPLPYASHQGLLKQVERVRSLHARDLAAGAGWVWLPTDMASKDISAGQSFGWQYLFPATRLSRDPRPRESMEIEMEGQSSDLSADNREPHAAVIATADLIQLRRHHIHENSVQKAIKQAVKKAGINKRASCHSLRQVWSYYISSLRLSYLKGNSACRESCLGSWRPLRTAVTEV